MSSVSRIVLLSVVGLLLVILALPLIGLTLSVDVMELPRVLARPTARGALWLSLQTSAAAVAVSVVLGTPAAWWISRRSSPDLLLTLLELPIVLPPAVLGVALLETYGRSGVIGSLLDAWGLGLPFSSGAVVLAQFLVGCPLYVLMAITAFRRVDDDLLLVARTLGASPIRAWMSVALPVAAPGLISGAALAWARALGEFGATLMFAGNLPGTTQTLPLAIYEALERDVSEATALAVILVALALGLLLGVRLLGSGGLRAQ